MSILESPFGDGSKVIVIDEEINALYARTLIAGWLQKWKCDTQPISVELLSFAHPKSYYSKGPEPFTSNNLTIHDFYTSDINDVIINDNEKVTYLLESLKRKALISGRSIVIIDDLSSLVVFVGVAKASKLIQELAVYIPKIICIYQRDFANPEVPRIETLGTTYIKLQKFNGSRLNNNLTYIAETVTRKSEKSVRKESLVVTQEIETYGIKVAKDHTLSGPETNINYSKDNDKIESSFRIDINEHEMEQKMKTPLPYAFDSKNNTSKILYIPEDADDLDEEDPDDDLCF